MTKRIRTGALVALLALSASAPAAAQEASSVTGPVPVECSTKPGTDQCVYTDADWCAIILPADIDPAVIEHCAGRVGDVFADWHTFTIPETLQASVTALLAETMQSILQPQATQQASVAPPLGSADVVIEWFRSQGIDVRESIAPHYWSANGPDDANPYTWAYLHIINGQPFILNVEQTAYNRKGRRLPLLQRTVDQFVPAASEWFKAAKAETKPGKAVSETFDGIEVEYTATRSSGAPGGSVHIEFPL